MNEPTGYENEPDEKFLPLPAELYSSLFHHQTVDSPEEKSYYQDILTYHYCQDILELGCGTGRICEHLMSAGFRHYGIDISREMLDFSRSFRQVPTVQMDMTRLGFKRVFDAVIIPCNSLNLLGNEKEIIQCLSEIRQVLRGPGLLILHLFVPDLLLMDSPGERIFQFSLFDLPEERRLIKETIRIYDPEQSHVILEERYKIRHSATSRGPENYTQSLTLAAFSSYKWFSIIRNSGFSVLSSHSHFNHTPFLENRDSTLLVVAQLC